MNATATPPVADEAARLRDEAVKRLKKKQDFRAHMLVYLLVNGLLWAIWALATSDSSPGRSSRWRAGASGW
jgi:hypothetical protein